MVPNPLTFLLLVLVARVSDAAEGAQTSTSSDANTASESQVERELKPDDWEPTHYKLYPKEIGHFMLPEEAFKLLKELEKIYEPFTDKQTNGRKTKVDRLIKLSDMNPRLCTRDRLKEYTDLIEEHMPFRTTLIPYIGDNLSNFTTMCEKNLLNHLPEDVGEIKKEFRDDMEEMAHMLSKQHIDNHELGLDILNKLWYYRDHVAERLLEFMEHKYRTRLAATYNEARDRKKKFYSLFDDMILEMCDAWINATDASEAFIEHVTAPKLESHMYTWLTYSHMCRFFKRDYYQVRKETYQQFKRHNCKFSKIRLVLLKKLKKFIGCHQL